MLLSPNFPLGVTLCSSLVIPPADVLPVGVILAQSPLDSQRVAAGLTRKDNEQQLAPTNTEPLK
jgi:hypothetical protein